MHDPHKVMVGLIGGPPVAIYVAAAELETLRAMVDRLSPVLPHDVHAAATETLRELDVRLGAIAALCGDINGPDMRVPLVPADMERLRRVYDAAGGADGVLRAVDGIHVLMRQLDRRIGAAQARIAIAAGRTAA